MTDLPEWMVISATRYAIGRMSYVVEETTEWLRHNWHTLPERAQAVILRDIETELQRDTEMRKRPVPPPKYPLGMDAGRRAWERVLERARGDGLCEAHKRFPCPECGTVHFDGCQCAVCRGVAK